MGNSLKYHAAYKKFVEHFLFLIVFFLGIIYANSQTKNVTYTSSNEAFLNPERGFYKHTSTHAGTYEALNQTELNNYRLNDKITLIYRNFNIDDFVNSPISSSYLKNMQDDFDKIRKAGLKCIIRFTYSKSKNVEQKDASKAIILAHILQLKPLFILNEDVIYVMQVGFIGSWGEWFYTSQAEFGGWGYNKTNLTVTNLNNRKEVIEAILNTLPASRMLQIRKPTFKQDLFSKLALTSAQSYNGTNIARIGHHNDCFLASEDDNGTYDDVTTQYPYLAKETKFVPMGGETCALNSPRTDCSTALAEMAKFHWSFLNLDYYPEVIDGFEQNNCFNDIQKKLGYRFELTSATFPQSVKIGEKLSITIKLKNQGFAVPFNKRKVYLVLKSNATNQVYPILMAANPRAWESPNEITLSEVLDLPSDLIRPANYKMYLYLPDNAASIAKRPEYAIRFANENVWEATTGYNNLNHTIAITEPTLALSDYSKLNVSIYPVPVKNKVFIELESLEDYKVSLFNSLGQNINFYSTSEKNKRTIDTESLSDGLYFVQLVKDAVKETRTFIIRH